MKIPMNNIFYKCYEKFRDDLSDKYKHVLKINNSIETIQTFKNKINNKNNKNSKNSVENIQTLKKQLLYNDKSVTNEIKSFNIKYNLSGGKKKHKCNTKTKSGKKCKNLTKTKSAKCYLHK